jgi:hypothetical protein
LKCRQLSFACTLKTKTDFQAQEEEWWCIKDYKKGDLVVVSRHDRHHLLIAKLLYCIRKQQSLVSANTKNGHDQEVERYALRLERELASTAQKEKGSPCKTTATITGTATKTGRFHVWCDARNGEGGG